jgi:hypothetical protein
MHKEEDNTVLVQRHKEKDEIFDISDILGFLNKKSVKFILAAIFNLFL